MDVHGHVRSRIASPAEGMVIGMVCNPLVSRGDADLHLARQGPGRERDGEEEEDFCVRGVWDGSER